MICPNCGAQLPDTAKMCFSCKMVFQNIKSGYQQNNGMYSGGNSNYQPNSYNQTNNLRTNNLQYQNSNQNRQPYQYAPASNTQPQNKSIISIIIPAAIIMVIVIIGAFIIKGIVDKSIESEPAKTAKSTEKNTSSKTEDSKNESTTTEVVYRDDISYDSLARTPDNYKGEYLQMSGEVIQVLEGEGEVDLRIAIDGDYDNVAFAVYDSSITSSRILEDDYVTVYGESQGLYTYESTMGVPITIPMIYVDSIELNENVSGSITSGSQTSSNGESTSSISLSDSDFDITSYGYDSYGYYYYYLVITNNSTVDVCVNGTAIAYDAEGNKEGADQSSLEILGAGETSVMFFFFDSLDECDHVEYELSYDTDSYYTPVVGNLSYEDTPNNSNVVLEVTNNGDVTAEFVQAYVFLFDSNNNIITVDETYITDDDSEIKPGATVTDQISFYESYDHYEIYFTGRHSKW